MIIIVGSMISEYNHFSSSSISQLTRVLQGNYRVLRLVCKELRQVVDEVFSKGKDPKLKFVLRFQRQYQRIPFQPSHLIQNLTGTIYYPRSIQILVQTTESSIPFDLNWYFGGWKRSCYFLPSSSQTSTPFHLLNL